MIYHFILFEILFADKNFKCFSNILISLKETLSRKKKITKRKLSKPKLYFILTAGFITTKVFKEGNSEIFIINIVIVIAYRLSDVRKRRRKRIKIQKFIMLVLAKMKSCSSISSFQLLNFCTVFHSRDIKIWCMKGFYKNAGYCI